MTAEPYQIKYDDLIRFIGQLYDAHQQTRKEIVSLKMLCSDLDKRIVLITAWLEASK